MDQRVSKPNFGPVPIPSTDGLAAHVLAKIAAFNARPMRREDDCRVLGWSIVENAS